MAGELEVGMLVQVAEALESVMAPCFGPQGGQVLFTTATGQVLITRDGATILDSLLLDHPAARLLVRAALCHSGQTGDGCKSLVLLVTELLRAALPAGRSGRVGVCRGLARLEREVLPRLLAERLGPHCGRVPGPGLGLLEVAARVLPGCLAGKVSPGQVAFLSQLACRYLRLVSGGGAGAVRRAVRLCSGGLAGLAVPVGGLAVGESRVLEGLPLSRGLAVPVGGLAVGESRVLEGLGVGESRAQEGLPLSRGLAVPVGGLAVGESRVLEGLGVGGSRVLEGLPLSRGLAVPVGGLAVGESRVLEGLGVGGSRVLEGLPLSRGLAVGGGDSSQGPTRALLLSGPLLPSLTQPGSTLAPSPTSLPGARARLSARLHRSLAGLQELGVTLLLSGPLQSGPVLEEAAASGLALVHGLADEEMALLARLSGVQPVSCPRLAGPQHALPVHFLRPLPSSPGLLLGLHLPAPLRPHCLLICAPLPTLAHQHQHAIASAYRLLNMLLPRQGAADEGGAWEGEGGGAWEGEGPCEGEGQGPWEGEGEEPGCWQGMRERMGLGVGEGPDQWEQEEPSLGGGGREGGGSGEGEGEGWGLGLCGLEGPSPGSTGRSKEGPGPMAPVRGIGGPEPDPETLGWGRPEPGAPGKGAAERGSQGPSTGGPGGKALGRERGGPGAQGEGALGGREGPGRGPDPAGREGTTAGALQWKQRGPERVTQAPDTRDPGGGREGHRSDGPDRGLAGTGGVSPGTPGREGGREGEQGREGEREGEQGGEGGLGREGELEREGGRAGHPGIADTEGTNGLGKEGAHSLASSGCPTPVRLGAGGTATGPGEWGWEPVTGSVLPVGGTFELLLHHYLEREAREQRCPDTRLACRLLAAAVLTIPRHLHGGTGPGCRAVLRARCGLQAGRVAPAGRGTLDVVAAKFQLLLSALQCGRRLLSVDRALPVRQPRHQHQHRAAPHTSH